MTHSLANAPLAALAMAAVLLTAAPDAARATDAHAHAEHPAAAASAPAAVPIDGVVRKVDKGAGKLTIWHGDVPQLQMGPMTMAFRVKEAVWLDQFKVGDKVRFQYQRSSGGLTITASEAVR